MEIKINKNCTLHLLRVKGLFNWKVSVTYTEPDPRETRVDLFNRWYNFVSSTRGLSAMALLIVLTSIKGPLYGKETRVVDLFLDISLGLAFLAAAGAFVWRLGFKTTVISRSTGDQTTRH